MSAITLTQLLCRNDPLFIWVNQKLKLKSTQIASGIAVLSFIALWVELSFAAWPFLRLVLVVSFQALVIFPLSVILYFAVPDFLAKPFAVLEESNSIADSLDADAESYHDFRGKMLSSVNSIFWILLAILAVVAYWYYRLFTNVPIDPSRLVPDEYRLWVRLALLVIYSPLLYMGVFTFGRILFGLLFIGRFFRSFMIRFNPMDPDGAGGIGFVGQMLITSVLIATAFGAGAAGLLYVTLAAGEDPLGRVEIIPLGLLYLTLTPLLFYSLLWSPHRAMTRARENSLKPIADEYQRVFAEGFPNGKADTKTVKARTDHLAEIKRQYELIRDTSPTWPLDVGSLVSILATSIVPAASTLFSPSIAGVVKIISQSLKSGSQ